MRVLREVAHAGSFSGAADSLGYTQPAVSRQIATLERETGTRLVKRLPHGVQLTDAGRVLVEHTETVLAQLSDAESELRALAGLEGGRLRLASFASAASSIVPLAIAAFRDRHPAVELNVTMMDPAQSVPLLRTGELDLALSHESVPSGDGLEVVALCDDPMYVVLPVGHPLGERPAVRLEDFAEEPWMLASTRTCPDSRLFRRVCMEAGFEPNVAFENDDYTAILGFVAAGVGVALIPDLALRGARDDVLIRSLGERAPVRRIAALVPAGFPTPAASAMLDVLVEVCERWSHEGRSLSVA